MKKRNDDARFQTHIPEPRWQQIISVVGIVVIVLIWIWLVVYRVYWKF